MHEPRLTGHNDMESGCALTKLTNSCSTETISFTFQTIPIWLRNSDFYQNLNKDDPNALIELPAAYFRTGDDSVESVEDLVHILRIIKFWGLKNIPLCVLEFCLTHSFDLWCTSVTEAIGEDRLSVYHTLKDAFRKPDEFSLLTAIYTRRPEVLDFWITKNGPNSKHGQKAIAHACRRGWIDLVQRLRHLNYEWNTEAYCKAAQYGHLPLLQYLYENGCPWDKRAYLYAKSSGQVTVMKFLEERGQSYP